MNATVATAPRQASPALPGQRKLRLAAAVVLLGSCLPWVDTAAGNFLGVQGAGLWTLSAGGIGLAGTFLRRRPVVLAHAVVLAGAALLLAGWQLARLASVCRSGGCVPGIGLGLTLFGGALALAAVLELGRSRQR